jgi:replicative DNA helicase
VNEYERALIGACRQDGNIFHQIRHLVKKEFFADVKARAIWGAMEAITDNKGDIDDLSIVAMLSQGGHSDAVATDLAHYSCDRPEHASQYAREVANGGIERSLRTVMSGIASDPNLNADQLLEKMQSNLVRIASARIGATEKQPKEIHTALQAKRKRAYETGNPVTGVLTGFSHLDWMTTGWQPGDLVAIGGDTHSGKSQFVCEVALAALRAGTPVALYESELTESAVRERLAAIHAGVSLPSIANLRVDPAVLDKAYAWLERQPIVIRQVKLTPTYLRSMIRLDQSKEGIGLVVIDHIQHMGGEGKDAREKMVHITAGLKEIALELEIPILAVSHLSRRRTCNESGVPVRPILSDFKESGSIEQDSDHCLFIWRPGLAVQSAEYPRDQICLVVGKNRATFELGTINLRFTQTGRIVEESPRPPLKKPTDTERRISHIFPGTEFPADAPEAA